MVTAKIMLEKIIDKYCIQNVGIKYADMIISRDNFALAVEEFNGLGYYIAEITWWEHRHVNSVSKNSMGGPIDVRNNQFFFGECWLEGQDFDVCDLQNNLKEAKAYCAIQFQAHNFYPAITLKIAFKD